MNYRWTAVFVLVAMMAAGGSSAEDVQWVRVTVLLERGPEKAQQNAESLIRGGIYSLEEVDRRGQEAIDREILERVRFLAGEMHDVEQSMRLGDLLSRQYYLPLRVGQSAVLPVIDLNPRLGIVLDPQRFVADHVVCKIRFLEPEGPPGAAEYTGEPISLTLKDAEIKDVIGVFARLTEREIVVDEGVGGHITVDLRDMPWDQAFDVVLRTNNLGWNAEGETLRVAPLDELSQRKRVRTEATINLPRGGAGSATIASRGDAKNRTVVLVVESVASEPDLVAERDGLLRPAAKGMTGRAGLKDTPMGDVLVFRGRATESGDLIDVKVLATPFSDASELFLEVSRTWRPWTVLDEQVRRIEAMVGYGLRVTQAPPSNQTAISLVEHVGVEIKGNPVEDQDGIYVITAVFTDLDTGEVISMPQVTTMKGKEANLRTGFVAPSGEPTTVEMRFLISEDGKTISYSWTLTRDSKVLNSHKAEFSL